LKWLGLVELVNINAPADAADCVKTQKPSKTKSFGEAEKRITGQV
jgi:hypothetical protein